ncbi:probable 28S ribosomal protein S23, mitochondrial [Odontomachus brunneus]|uniref:probable 28S ribosomal protein S23, mitochondrial n=1 Tax=Odontomachus brunneus TaxID=486640 RepID=UPI0013F1F6BC|nr:probable 28S ribosomal protein S23, mitochondrial [Odontomachus brunneus]XP_032668874.1 probable 28S ribosomal protein S23, mitochondrial [Odontomachus brunneus]
MAQSRLEKIGTIYSRINSLLRGGAIKQEDTPLWLAVYEAFPPKYEPRFDRQLPSKPIRAIFYEEDLVRAKFHKDQSFLPSTNLKSEDIKTTTQYFLSMYKTIQKEGGLSADNAYERALLRYRSEINTKTK